MKLVKISPQGKQNFFLLFFSREPRDLFFFPSRAYPTVAKIVTYCEAEGSGEIYVHNINGQMLARLPTTSQLYSMLISYDGEHLITGTEDRTILNFI